MTAMAERISNLATNSWNNEKSLNRLFDGAMGKLKPQDLIEFGSIGYVTVRKKIMNQMEAGMFH